MFENLSQKLLTLGKFSKTELQIVVDNFKIQKYLKSQPLLKQGMICQSIYYVNQGSFRQFEVLENGEELSFNLFVEGDWLLDYKSFTSQQPSKLTTEANENSMIFQLTVDDFHKLMKASDSFFQLGRIFQYGVEKQESVLNANPKQRYEFLMQTKPKIIQKFQLKHIASFLNMTPETLSRVRGSFN